MFYGKQHTKAIEYLNKWGQKFWEETEYRIKEVTNTLEKGITGAIQSQVPIASICAGAKLNLTEKQKSEVINRAQKVVNTVQIRQLSDILELINDVLSDEQKPHYIVIDGLDENWVDENLRYKLIRALIETVKDFRKVQNAKIIVAIRLDLLERVFKFTRDAGFQEEKYESLYYNVRWDEEQLEHILNLRINSLIKEKYTKRFVDIKDLLPRKIENNNPLHYMIERTMMRPRDIILFFNQCIQEANNKPIITSQMIKTAEGEYSRLRLRSLADEWRSDYPNLEEYVDVLKNRSKTFSLLEITEKEISDFCLNLAVKKVNEKDGLFFNAREVAEGSLDPNAFKAKLFLVFYNLGLIGLKLGPYEKANWITSGRRNVSLVEISDDIRAVIHPMFWRVLGIKIK